MINVLFTLFRGVRDTAAKRICQSCVLFFSLLCYSTTGFMYFEFADQPELSWNDALWWAVVTMTTVGYGDFFPTTDWGRLIIGFPTMFFGVGILGYMLSLMATAVFERRMLETRGMNEITLNGHVIICGMGDLQGLLKLVGEIRRDSQTGTAGIVLIDPELEQLPPELVALNVSFVHGDPAREAILKKAGLLTARAVVIQAHAERTEDSDNHNLKVALMAGTLAPAVFMVAECVEMENERFFRRAHCDSVVCIAALAEQMLVQELQDTGVAQVVAELTSNVHGRQFYIVDLPQEVASFQELRGLYGDLSAVLLGVRRAESNHILPGDDFPVQASDKAIIISDSRPSHAI